MDGSSCTRRRRSTKARSRGRNTDSLRIRRGEGGSSPHEVEPLLPRQHPLPPPLRIEENLLLLRHAHLLAVPLGNAARDLQLGGEPAVRADRHIAACGNAFLPVPQPDQRTGTMAMVADGM